MVDFDGTAGGRARRASRRRSPRCATTSRRCRSRTSRSCCARSSAGRSRRCSPSSTSDAFAAASIGQVHRATTVDGRRRRRQDPVPGGRRGGRDRPAQPAMLLLPLVKRLAPGLDVKALAAELRERIAEELDYELEAQNQRAHRRAACAAIRSSSCRRVRHEPVDAPRAGHRVRRGRALRGRATRSTRRSATATARSSSASSSALLYRDRIALGDPHPGNYLLCRRRPRRLPRLRADARSSTPTTSTASGRSRAPSRAGDAAALKAALRRGRLPAGRPGGRGRRRLRAGLMRHGDRVVRGPG